MTSSERQQYMICGNRQVTCILSITYLMMLAGRRSDRASCRRGKARSNLHTLGQRLFHTRGLPWCATITAAHRACQHNLFAPTAKQHRPFLIVALQLSRHRVSTAISHEHPTTRTPATLTPPPSWTCSISLQSYSKRLRMIWLTLLVFEVYGSYAPSTAYLRLKLSTKS